MLILRSAPISAEEKSVTFSCLDPRFLLAFSGFLPACDLFFLDSRGFWYRLFPRPKPCGGPHSRLSLAVFSLHRPFQLRIIEDLRRWNRNNSVVNHGGHTTDHTCSHDFFASAHLHQRFEPSGRLSSTALNTARTGSISAFQLDQQFGSFGFGSGLSHDFAPVHRLALAFGHACRTIR